MSSSGQPRRLEGVLEQSAEGRQDVNTHCHAPNASQKGVGRAWKDRVARVWKDCSTWEGARRKFLRHVEDPILIPI